MDMNDTNISSVFRVGFETRFVSQYQTLHSGIWGSAYTIMLQRLLVDKKDPSEIKKEVKGDGREELGKNNVHCW